MTTNTDKNQITDAEIAEYFSQLPQPVKQIDELHKALEAHKLSPKLWTDKNNMYVQRIYLNFYDKVYQVCILEVYGTPYPAPGYEYLLDNFFVEFNLQEREMQVDEKTGVSKAKPYTKDQIQELKTAKFKLCEKFNEWGLLNPQALYSNDKIVSLWRPQAEKAPFIALEDRKI